MFQRNYTVKGEDVNDFMVMQNTAYLKYSSKIFETFLFVKGFTNQKMNKLNVGLQKRSDQILQLQPLLFTESFIVELKFNNLLYTNQKMNIDIYFYNQKKELCAKINRELFWFDYTAWQTISPPKIIANYFV